MRFAPRAILAGGLGFAVALIVSACGGGSGLLSSDQSNSISTQLSQISSSIQAGDCSGVSKATVSLSRAVAELPATVNPRLRQDLDQGVSTVGQLANQQCRPRAATTSTSSSSTSSTTTTTTTTPTTPTTTSTSTTPATTSSTSAAPPATTPASPGTTSTGSGGAGLGGGNGASGGNGNSQGGGGAAPAGAVAPGPPGGATADKGNGGNGR